MFYSSRISKYQFNVNRIKKKKLSYQNKRVRSLRLTDTMCRNHLNNQTMRKSNDNHHWERINVKLLLEQLRQLEANTKQQLINI